MTPGCWMCDPDPAASSSPDGLCAECKARREGADERERLEKEAAAAKERAMFAEAYDYAVSVVDHRPWRSRQ